MEKIITGMLTEQLTEKVTVKTMAGKTNNLHSPTRPSCFRARYQAVSVGHGELALGNDEKSVPGKSGFKVCLGGGGLSCLVAFVTPFTILFLRLPTNVICVSLAASYKTRPFQFSFHIL